MRHRLVVIIWNGEEFQKSLDEHDEPSQSGQGVIEEALELYGVKLVHAATVQHTGGGITRYISSWVGGKQRKPHKVLYREVLLHLPPSAEPEVLIEFEIPESDQYDK